MNPLIRIGQPLYKTTSRIGEHLQWDWLTYNYGVTWSFHRLARRNAPGFVDVMLKAFPLVESIVDIGCGSGVYVQEFNHRGIQAVGCEYSRRARRWARRAGATVYPFDLSQSSSSVPGSPFDMAMSLEVAEHVPESLADALVDYLMDAASLLVFSAAQPNQPEAIGHVNEQKPTYWITKFEDKGCCFEKKKTAMVAAMIRNNNLAYFLSDNLMIFTR